MPSTRFAALSFGAVSLVATSSFLFGAATRVTGLPPSITSSLSNTGFNDLFTRATATAAAKSFDYSCTQPPLSTSSAAWSKETDIRNNLGPKPLDPIPIFWSGRYHDQSVLPIAEKCAKEKSGATIGQLMCNRDKAGKKLTMPADGTGDKGTEVWNIASRVFAEYTGATAYVLAGDAFVTSIWFKTEWPTLKENLATKLVIGIDPGTCKDVCFWHCPVAADCKGLTPCQVRTINQVPAK